MKTISAAEARRLDLNSEELGVTVDRLMANAGKALARVVKARLKGGQAAVFLCGKGNNGGDGFAAAAELQSQGHVAWVVLAEAASRIRSPAARAYFARLAKGTVFRWTGRAKAPWTNARVVVDCLLGSGLQGPPKAPYSAMIAWANRRRSQRATLIACDIPSGLGTARAVNPHETVTFHAAKVGMTPANSGRIRVATIGIPRRADTDIGVGDFVSGYRVPSWDSHKGDNGVVLVVAGSVPLMGAARYVASGAYRTGADLVHIAAPEQAVRVLRNWGPDPIVHAANAGNVLAPDCLDIIEPLLDKCTAVVIGPGLGTRKSTRKAAHLVLEAAAKRGLPMVVDADALDALDDDLLREHGRRMVLTPHAREFRDLADKDATRANVQRYAREHGSVTILRKSSIDVVSDGVRTRECRLGHPTLTVGGTGDVLAGIVGALLAKGAPPFEAACAASYLLKSAGEVAAQMRSYGAGPLDVAEAIPAILLRLPA